MAKAHESWLEYLLRNRTIRMFLSNYSENDWQEVCKLTLLYGIIGLHFTDGKAIIPLEKLRDIVNSGSSAVAVEKALPELNNQLEDLRSKLDDVVLDTHGQPNSAKHLLRKPEQAASAARPPNAVPSAGEQQKEQQVRSDLASANVALRHAGKWLRYKADGLPLHPQQMPPKMVATAVAAAAAERAISPSGARPPSDWRDGDPRPTHSPPGRKRSPVQPGSGLGGAMYPSWWGDGEEWRSGPRGAQAAGPRSRSAPRPGRQAPRLAYSVQTDAEKPPIWQNDLVTARYVDVPSSGYGRWGSPPRVPPQYLPPPQLQQQQQAVPYGHGEPYGAGYGGGGGMGGAPGPQLYVVHPSGPMVPAGQPPPQQHYQQQQRARPRPQSSQQQQSPPRDSAPTGRPAWKLIRTAQSRIRDQVRADRAAARERNEARQRAVAMAMARASSGGGGGGGNYGGAAGLQGMPGGPSAPAHASRYPSAGPGDIADSLAANPYTAWFMGPQTEPSAAGPGGGQPAEPHHNHHHHHTQRPTTAPPPPQERPPSPQRSPRPTPVPSCVVGPTQHHPSGGWPVLPHLSAPAATDGSQPYAASPHQPPPYGGWAAPPQPPPADVAGPSHHPPDGAASTSTAHHPFAPPPPSAPSDGLESSSYFGGDRPRPSGGCLHHNLRSSMSAPPQPPPHSPHPPPPSYPSVPMPVYSPRNSGARPAGPPAAPKPAFPPPYPYAPYSSHSEADDPSKARVVWADEAYLAQPPPQGWLDPMPPSGPWLPLPPSQHPSAPPQYAVQHAPQPPYGAWGGPYQAPQVGRPWSAGAAGDWLSAGGAGVGAGWQAPPPQRSGGFGSSGISPIMSSLLRVRPEVVQLSKSWVGDFGHLDRSSTASQSDISDREVIAVQSSSPAADAVAAIAAADELLAEAAAKEAVKEAVQRAVAADQNHRSGTAYNSALDQRLPEGDRGNMLGGGAGQGSGGRTAGLAADGVARGAGYMEERAWGPVMGQVARLGNAVEPELGSTWMEARGAAGQSERPVKANTKWDFEKMFDPSNGLTYQ